MNRVLGLVGVCAVACCAAACGGTSASDIGGGDGSTGGSGGDPSSYDSMFGAPSSSTTTPNSLDGIWATKVDMDTYQLDVRLRIESASLSIADRCTFTDGTVLTTGVTVATNVDAQARTITVRESQSNQATSGTERCYASASPATDSYVLSGTNLTLQFGGDSLALVKIGDP